MPEINSINSDGHVLVIGAAGIDVKGRPQGALQHGTAAKGSVQFSLGGVARNIAENLARLEIPTILLTVLGDDRNGQVVIENGEAAGIDMSHILQMSGERTGSYLALITQNNDLEAAISDYHIIEMLTPEFLRSHADLFVDAAMIVIDANLSVPALAVIFELANRHNVPVCADPTAAVLANKLAPHLSDLYMVAPNSVETTALCGLAVHDQSIEDTLQVARHLVSLGVEIAIITLAERGLVYADSAGAGHVPALHTNIVDPTGAGDALTAGVIFGLLNDVPLDEAMRLGVSAATLTLRSRESVLPELSQELLYEELVI